MTRQLTDTPRLLTLERFLQIYFEGNACLSGNYFPWSEIARDNKFAYLKRVSKKGTDMYKVLLSDLQRIKFDTWSICDIKAEFFTKVVSEKDRARRESFICNTTPSSATYTYTYLNNLNSLQINLHWRIFCDQFITLVNKKYSATYHFDTGTFTDIH